MSLSRVYSGTDVGGNFGPKKQGTVRDSFVNRVTRGNTDPTHAVSGSGSCTTSSHEETHEPTSYIHTARSLWLLSMAQYLVSRLVSLANGVEFDMASLGIAAGEQDTSRLVSLLLTFTFT